MDNLKKIDADTDKSNQDFISGCPFATGIHFRYFESSQYTPIARKSQNIICKVHFKH